MDFPGAPPGTGLPDPTPVLSSGHSSHEMLPGLTMSSGGPALPYVTGDATTGHKRSVDDAGFCDSPDDAAGGGGGGGGGSVDDSKDLTEQQKLERRERNREHAKRSRLRKKFLLESLQEQIHGLEEQIEGFKKAIQAALPEQAEQIIRNVCGDREKYTPLPMPSGFGPVKTLMEPDFRLSKWHRFDRKICSQWVVDTYAPRRANEILTLVLSFHYFVPRFS